MRALRILLIIAVVLGGLFVAADRVAVNLAEDEVAKKVKSSQGLTGDPEVSIEGFPFLTQVVTKELDEVKVNLDGMTASADGHALRVTEMTANLYDVEIGSDFSSATAATATGSASISYDDLSKAADEGIITSYGGESDSGKPQVKVTARIELPGLPRFDGSVLSTVSIVDGDTLRLQADEVPAEGIPGVEERVREKVDRDWKITGLPEGLEFDTVAVTKAGIEVTVKGRQVALAG